MGELKREAARQGPALRLLLRSYRKQDKSVPQRSRHNRF
jgi:hypothetical protein